MEIQTRVVELQPRGSFRIARARSAPYANVLLRVEQDGIVGWGEASPNPFYGVSAEDVCQRLHETGDWLRSLRIRTVADLEAAWVYSWKFLHPYRAAQCALDLALWDWLGRRLDVSAGNLALGFAPKPVTSFATIGLSTPDEFEAKLAALRDFPRIKLKSDQQAAIEPLRRVCEATGAEVAVDANCAWPARNFTTLSTACATAGAVLIEQPFAPDQSERLVRGSYALPVFADESCIQEEDVEQLATHFDGINVKLVKCGGLTPALRMLRQAHELGMRTMVGCMLESSVLIAAGCVAAQIADYADLDGAWLLETDPCTGWQWDHGILRPPTGLGLAATPREMS